MKPLRLIATLVLATFSSAFAITDAEITPAALLGKTLTFAIENGGSPYATNGTWSAVFAASGNGFTATRITGDLANISTTYSSVLNGTFTEVSLATFVQGQKPATLTLYTVSGIGHYEVSIADLFGVSLNGTFAFGTTAVKAPEISIQQPLGSELTDGSSTKNIGYARIGKSISKTFTITNSGTSTLKNIATTINGKNKADFSVTSLAKTSLAPKASTTFTVTLRPKTIGAKNAAIHITSSDADENPFDIKLTGTGAGIK